MGASHSHTHDHAAPTSKKALGAALALTLAYTAVEVVGGLLTGSLALLADAGHMLSDNISLALALGAVWLAGRPATSQRTLGYQRAEILAALVNGVALVVIALWIVYAAIQRFQDPPDVLAGWMLVVAFVGLFVNVGAGLILYRARGDSLNIEAAFRHVLADLLGSIGVIAAALTILLTGWLRADPLISVLIGVLILASAWSVIRDSTAILLESTPKGIDADEVGRRMAGAPGVTQVHDLHVWTITSGFTALSAHVLVGAGEDCHLRRRELEVILEHDFGITHTTLQVDHVPEGQLVELTPRRDTGSSSA
jgi:cobalt-zinc-cadmium efflux system protein